MYIGRSLIIMECPWVVVFFSFEWCVLCVVGKRLLKLVDGVVESSLCCTEEACMHSVRLG